MPKINKRAKVTLEELLARKKQVKRAFYEKRRKQFGKWTFGPTHFCIWCHEAMQPGGGGYARIAERLCHCLNDMLQDSENGDAYITSDDKFAEFEKLLDHDGWNIACGEVTMTIKHPAHAKVLAWFDREFKPLMRYIPNKKRMQFLLGVYRTGFDCI